MGIEYISEGDPFSKVALRIKWRFSQDWPPQEKIEVRRDPSNLSWRQEPRTLLMPPLPRAPAKKSPSTS